MTCLGLFPKKLLMLPGIAERVRDLTRPRTHGQNRPARRRQRHHLLLFRQPDDGNRPRRQMEAVHEGRSRQSDHRRRACPWRIANQPGGTITTTYTYDGLGRTIRTVQPDGVSATTYSYSGNQTTVTDPAGNWKQFTKDVLGNLITVVEPDPANQPSGTLTTTYTC